MKQFDKSNDEELLLLQLKDILLREDREALLKLQAVLDEEEQLSERVSPIIKKHLSFLKENFKTEYGETVNEIIEEKIKDSDEEIMQMIQPHLDKLIQPHLDKMIKQKLIESQDDIVNIIYPKLDTMIKKYITAAFQKLKENLDSQLTKVKSTISPKTLFNRFFGPKQSDVILSNLDHPDIHEIYVIQRNSGLLLGSFSRTKNIDQDVIAGMLTAIKSFVEDAFQEGQDDLEMIQYENYKIFLQNLPAYYFAVAISGSLSAAEKENLSTNLISFAEKEIPFLIEDIDETLTEAISSKLKVHFEELTTESIQT